MSTPSAGGRPAAPPLSVMSACLTVRWPITCHARLSDRRLVFSWELVLMGGGLGKWEAGRRAWSQRREVRVFFVVGAGGQRGLVAVSEPGALRGVFGGL